MRFQKKQRTEAKDSISYDQCWRCEYMPVSGCAKYKGKNGRSVWNKRARAGEQVGKEDTGSAPLDQVHRITLMEPGKQKKHPGHRGLVLWGCHSSNDINN